MNLINKYEGVIVLSKFNFILILSCSLIITVFIISIINLSKWADLFLGGFQILSKGQ